MWEIVAHCIQKIYLRLKVNEFEQVEEDVIFIIQESFKVVAIIIDQKWEMNFVYEKVIINSLVKHMCNNGHKVMRLRDNNILFYKSYIIM